MKRATNTICPTASELGGETTVSRVLLGFVSHFNDRETRVFRLYILISAKHDRFRCLQMVERTNLERIGRHGPDLPNAFMHEQLEMRQSDLTMPK